MATMYFKNGITYNIVDSSDTTATDSLPPGTYTVTYNKMSGSYCLVSVPDFVQAAKAFAGIVPNTRSFKFTNANGFTAVYTPIITPALSFSAL